MRNGHYVLLLAGLLLFALNSCGGNDTRDTLAMGQLNATAAPGQDSGLSKPRESQAGFDIGSIYELDRGTSYTDDDRLLLGAEFDSSLPHQGVAVNGDSAAFSPSYKPSLDPSLINPAFAIYSFNLGDYDQEIQLVFGVSGGPETPEDLYFAIADYGSGNWDWKRNDGSLTLDLPEFQNYISPGGRIYFCVAMTGVSSASMDYVRIGTGFPPSGDLLVDQKTGNYPLTVVFDADFADMDGTLVEYQWDYNNDDVIDETSTEALHQHTFPVPGTFVTRVHVVDNDGMQGTDFVTINVTGVLPPNPPENVQASDGSYGSQIHISWEKPSTGPAPKGFEIDRADSENGTYEMVGAVSFAFTEYADTSVPDGNTYWYKVISLHDTIGNSVPSESDDGFRGHLDPPTNLACGKGLLADRISISWSHPSAGQTPEGYDIFRSTTTDGLKSFVASVGFETFYQDTSVPDGQVYYYFIQSRRTNFPNSDFSEPESGYVAQLNAPTDLQAADDASPSLVHVSWTHSAGPQIPTGYNIWRADAEDGSYSKVAFVGYVDNWDDEAATDGEVYWYKVDAYKPGWPDSALSDSDSGYVGLSAPQALNASDDEVDQVTVTWLPPAIGKTPDDFEIFRADSVDGTYASLGVTAANFFVDTPPAFGVSYYYKAVARKAGYNNSPDSNIDDGTALDA